MKLLLTHAFITSRIDYCNSSLRLKETKIEINLSNISLKRVSFTKFLGVIIHEKLSFTRHISYINNKSSKAMGIIIKA